MAGPNDPALGFADSAFEEPRRGVTRVFHGNQEGPASRDDPLVHQLVERVSELLARVDDLTERVQKLEGDMQDGWDGGDDEPPI